jgi:hypothetical protein
LLNPKRHEFLHKIRFKHTLNKRCCLFVLSRFDLARWRLAWSACNPIPIRRFPALLNSATILDRMIKKSAAALAEGG